MNRTRAGILVLFIAVTANAGDKPSAKAAAADALAALKKAHAEAEAAYYKTAQALPDTPEGQKKENELWQAYDKGQAERFQAAVDLARADPKSDAGFAALEWVLTIPRAYYHPAGKPAMELATQHHAANPKIGKIVAWVGRYPPHGAESYPAAVELIKTVAQKNPDRTARGQAVLALAWQAKGRFAVAEYKKSAEKDTLAAEAEKAFEGMLRNYVDCLWLRQGEPRTLGEEARSELYELRFLRVGKAAPDVEGEDLDGTSFKLSDYRGKVTVLVFWASWCGPCMRMVPDERKLVAKLKDKPFALVGVNGDDDRAKAKQVTVKQQMSWRSFWNGDKGRQGPLARAWNVRGWPRVYIMDHKGVIRAKDVRGEEMEEAIEHLLGEMAGPQK